MGDTPTSPICEEPPRPLRTWNRAILGPKGSRGYGVPVTRVPTAQPERTETHAVRCVRYHPASEHYTLCVSGLRAWTMANVGPTRGRTPVLEPGCVKLPDSAEVQSAEARCP